MLWKTFRKRNRKHATLWVWPFILVTLVLKFDSTPPDPNPPGSISDLTKTTSSVDLSWCVLASVCLWWPGVPRLVTYNVIDSRDNTAECRVVCEAPITAGPGFQTAYLNLSELHPTFVKAGLSQEAFVWITFPLSLALCCHTWPGCERTWWER